MSDLIEFLQPVSLQQLNDDEGYTDGQLAKHIQLFEEELPDITQADIVLLGIAETRGNGYFEADNNAANIIRKHLYQLHCWHTEIQIAGFAETMIFDR